MCVDRIFVLCFEKKSSLGSDVLCKLPISPLLIDLHLGHVLATFRLEKNLCERRGYDTVKASCNIYPLEGRSSNVLELIEP